MPYKRRASPFFQVQRKNLPGYGAIGQISSGSRSRRIATAMERALDHVAERALVEPSYRRLLDAVRHREIDLPTLLSHVSARTLDHLLVRLTDQDLRAVILTYMATAKKGRGVRLGFNLLDELAPHSAKLSWLRDPKNVLRVCAAAERGEPADAEGKLTPRKRNSVRRTLLRSISLLLRHELGKAERDRIFAEIDFASEDDTREVVLEPAEIKRLFEACDTLAERTGNSGYVELRVAIRLMLQTSADRGSVFSGTRSGGEALGLRVRQLRVFEDDGRLSGEAFIQDTKNSERPRTVPLTDGMCRELLVLSQGKRPDDSVFSVPYSGSDYLWNQVRREAELPHIRLKDLRSVAAIYAERAGVPLTVASRVLGHSDSAMTRRYQRYGAAMSEVQAGAIERELGLTG